MMKLLLLIILLLEIKNLSFDGVYRVKPRDSGLNKNNLKIIEADIINLTFSTLLLLILFMTLPPRLPKRFCCN